MAFARCWGEGDLVCELVRRDGHTQKPDGRRWGHFRSQVETRNPGQRRWGTRGRHRLVRAGASFPRGPRVCGGTCREFVSRSAVPQPADGIQCGPMLVSSISGARMREGKSAACRMGRRRQIRTWVGKPEAGCRGWPGGPGRDSCMCVQDGLLGVTVLPAEPGLLGPPHPARPIGTGTIS